jgi:serine protease
MFVLLFVIFFICCRADIAYNIKLIQADLLSIGDHSVSVCVVDTGVFIEHPVFDSRLVSGVNRFSKYSNSTLFWNEDHVGHGTVIVSILSAIPASSFDILGVGRIPVYVTRGLTDTRSGRDADVVEALLQCMKHGSRVISLSISSVGLSAALHVLLDQMFSDGVIVVAAVGNDGLPIGRFPAAYPTVIGVSAVDHLSKWWPKSNYGLFVDFCAPGHMIRSAGFNHMRAPGVVYYSGTSMAAPHVAAGFALLLSHFPNATQSVLYDALKVTSTKLGDTRYFGNGLIQLYDAYIYLSQRCVSDIVHVL